MCIKDKSVIEPSRKGEIMNVLVACEESQEVCKAFRERGHNAYSCDIQECSGGHPEWHILADVLPLLDGYRLFWTMDGAEHDDVLNDPWDLIIAHPPCTELCSSGQRWFTEGRKDYRLQREAIAFFYRFVMADCDKIAIENPVGVMSSAYRKPDCIINPWQFGHPEQKKTCLWLKGLPPLKETNNVYDYMMTLPLKERTRIWQMGSNHGKERSKTYHGIAQAMAEQWG
jgi:hypothetical protein